MPAFWWHFLVSSLPLKMVVGWLTQSGVDMTDFDLSLSVSPFCYSPSGLLHMSTHIHPGKAERRSMKWDAKYCSPCDMEGKKIVTEKGQKKRRSRPNYWPWWEVCEFSSPLMGVLIFLQYNVVRRSQWVGTKCGLGPELHPGGTLPFKKWIGNCCKKSQKIAAVLQIGGKRAAGRAEGNEIRNP